MDGERIGVVFTGKDCELAKPRLLLGSILWRWMHWRDRSVPCLRDYGLECKPCGEQREYAYLTAAMVEQVESTRQQALDDRHARWQALSEEDRQKLRRDVRIRHPEAFKWSDDLLDGMCRQHLFGARAPVAEQPHYFPTRRFLQCVPGPALEGFDIGNLRGLVVAIRKDRYSHIRLATLPIQLEPLEDFAPQPVFDRRYGLDRLTRSAPPKQVGDEPPAVLPFRKQA
jgi:hypothetical protein